MKYSVFLLTCVTQVGHLRVIVVKFLIFCIYIYVFGFVVFSYFSRTTCGFPKKFSCTQWRQFGILEIWRLQQQQQILAIYYARRVDTAVNAWRIVEFERNAVIDVVIYFLQLTGFFLIQYLVGKQLLRGSSKIFLLIFILTISSLKRF